MIAVIFPYRLHALLVSPAFDPCLPTFRQLVLSSRSLVADHQSPWSSSH